MMAPEPVRAAARAASGVARHAAWWLRYRVHGSTRPAPIVPRKRPRTRAGNGNGASGE
jgi:hypothetical protein